MFGIGKALLMLVFSLSPAAFASDDGLPKLIIDDSDFGTDFPYYFHSSDFHDDWLVPLVRPIPVYPNFDTEPWPEADCDAKFDLSDDGLPINIDVCCSNAAFVESTHKAISKMKYLSKDAVHYPHKRSGYVYPIAYRLN